MQAVLVNEFGAPDVLELREAPVPEPGPGQVLVQVAAADVMFLDTRLRSGWGTDFFPVQPPYIPGGAIGGTVRAVGPGVDTGWLGRRVATRTAASGIGGGLPIGGYAEQALAVAETLTEIPDGVSLDQATALVHDGHTALAVFDRATVRPGDSVLITAAAGGLGTLLIQLARQAGAQVIAAARGATKLALTERLGAHTGIDYSEPNWTDRVLAATDGQAPRVVLDGAGGNLGDAALAVAADGGRFIGYGAAAGEFAGSAAEHARQRGVEVVGLHDLTNTGDDHRAASAARILDAVATGAIEVVIGQTYPLAEAAGAHAAIEARTALGRTLLRIG
ncbi:zinc-binding dehydrogenase [Nocardia speluncae]|uniref:Zinc-binding dehydrogenase n=1 Tax=Nocardia speluncae TaxID=419477 RepID=A0A846XDB1_9NOCA|nr:zinc-binding dehydrogenase [Nocardia speluncae]NKY33387.1 zinc-binding dehydrogenase [Nocardia speluncae]